MLGLNQQLGGLIHDPLMLGVESASTNTSNTDSVYITTLRKSHLLSSGTAKFDIHKGKRFNHAKPI